MLLILPVFLPLVTARDVPQLEVLFYSSDEVPPPSTSPLQSGQQLARNQPRRKVEVAYKKGFPTPTDFYTNFVERRRPVVFSGAMDDSQYEFLKLESLNISSRAALSFTSVSSFKSQEKLTESIRNFVNQKMGETYYLSERLHKNLKAQTLLPACLQCSYLADLLFDTTHNILGHVYPLPMKQNVHDVLHCQVDGSREILMVDSREFPDITQVLDINTPPYGSASLLNTLSVDFERYPSLRKVSLFHIALLGPGDCLYIPSQWVHQSNILSHDNSLEFSWRPESWTPDDDCSRAFKQRIISTLSFLGEGYAGIEKTMDTEEILMVKLTKLLDKLLSLKTNIELSTFLTEMVSDVSLTPDMQEWTEECRDRLSEMFKTIDVNSDGHINNDDLKAITDQNVKRFIGRMEDRFADLNDVIIDQRVDFSLGHLKPHSRRELVEEVRESDETERSRSREEL